MPLDVDIRVRQVVSAWCPSRQKMEMELTTAFVSENVVGGKVYAYTLTITKYGRARRYKRAQGSVESRRAPDDYSSSAQIVLT